MKETYRNFNIDFDMPPIPIRQFDWCGVHEDYDGATDAHDNRVVYGETLEECKKNIDEFIEENPELFEEE